MTDAARQSQSSRLIVLGDVDAAGVLYFGNVFRWHEEVFTRWLAQVDVPLHGLFGTGRGLPVRSSWAEYPASARLGETLKMTPAVTSLRDTEFVFETTWCEEVFSREVLRVSTRHVACVKDEDTGFFVRTSIWPGLRKALQTLAREAEGQCQQTS
ncbi:acyl-CoA thioesterase [Microbacterium sp. X-17]|uniref:acyl-CoA thioesterase n=1 Tax=Microbacterium sp. X-17 TaxID=3144404 RepID=UPI0031F57B43